MPWCARGSLGKDPRAMGGEVLSSGVLMGGRTPFLVEFVRVTGGSSSEIKTLPLMEFACRIGFCGDRRHQRTFNFNRAYVGICILV